MAKKKKKRKGGMFAKIILFAFVIYSAATLISLQVKINAQRDTVSVLESQVEEERAKQSQLRQLLEEELQEEYIVSEAQKQGYAAPNERVFVDVSGQ